ncbi:MAG: hypothetical protein AB1796_01650 [Bacillota bacterium]
MSPVSMTGPSSAAQAAAGAVNNNTVAGSPRIIPRVNSDVLICPSPFFDNEKKLTRTPPQSTTKPLLISNLYSIHGDSMRRIRDSLIFSTLSPRLASEKPVSKSTRGSRINSVDPREYGRNETVQ